MCVHLDVISDMHAQSQQAYLLKDNTMPSHIHVWMYIINAACIKPMIARIVRSHESTPDLHVVLRHKIYLMDINNRLAFFVRF